MATAGSVDYYNLGFYTGTVLVWVGMFHAVGSRGGPLRARANAYVLTILLATRCSRLRVLWRRTYGSLRRAGCCCLGIGLGGEWTLGGTFVAEEWPEERRKMGAGWMQTGSPTSGFGGDAVERDGRRGVWMARDVRDRGSTRVAGELDPVRRARAGADGSRPNRPRARWRCCSRRNIDGGYLLNATYLFISICGLWELGSV